MQLYTIANTKLEAEDIKLGDRHDGNVFFVVVPNSRWQLAST